MPHVLHGRVTNPISIASAGRGQRRPRSKRNASCLARKSYKPDLHRLRRTRATPTAVKTKCLMSCTEELQTRSPSPPPDEGNADRGQNEMPHVLHGRVTNPISIASA